MQEAETSEHSGYTTLNGVVDSNGKTTTYAGYNKGFLAPGASLNLGYVLKDEEEGPYVELGLGYDINVPLYNNSIPFGRSGSIAGTYEYQSGNTKIIKEGPVAVVTENSNLTLTTISRMSHIITPSLYYSREVSEGFTAGLYAELGTDLNFRTEESWDERRVLTTTSYAYDSTQNTVEETLNVGVKTKTDITSISITPDIAAGAMYDLLPNKVRLNAGIGFNIPYTYTLTREAPESGFGSHSKTKKDSEGNDIDPPETGPFPTTPSMEKTVTVTEDSRWGGIKPRVSLGFTVFFGPKASLDASFDASTGTTYDVNLSQVKLLFTLKN
jgi:hypothetical protein